MAHSAETQMRRERQQKGHQRVNRVRPRRSQCFILRFCKQWCDTGMCSFRTTPLHTGWRKCLKERDLSQREVIPITEGRQDGGLDLGNGHGPREAESEGLGTGLGDWTGLGPGLDVSSKGDGTSISKKLGFNRLGESRAYAHLRSFSLSLTSTIPVQPIEGGVHFNFLPSIRVHYRGFSPPCTCIFTFIFT